MSIVNSFYKQKQMTSLQKLSKDYTKELDQV